MKDQFNNSFLKRQELATVLGSVRVCDKETDVWFPINLTDTLLVERYVPSLFFNLYLEVLHRRYTDEKAPSDLRARAVGGGNYRGSMFEKRCPLRGLTLLFYFSPAGGGGYWRGLSKGAALLHQGVYYDRDAPCETVVLSLSAINGWSVYAPRPDLKIRLLKSHVASAWVRPVD